MPKSATLKPIICPSILSSDFANLATEAARMKNAGAHFLHVDVMDGHFVPNLTLGAPIVSSLSKATDMFLDCHLMVSDPGFWVDDFVKAGASQLTFHFEATNDPLALLQLIKSKGIKSGLALKPATPIPDSLDTLLPYLDLLLIMTVEPGFGGQKLIPHTLEKVASARTKYPDLNIQVDGGIDVSNITLVADAGANVIVSGTGIFKASDAKLAIQSMCSAVTAALEK